MKYLPTSLVLVLLVFNHVVYADDWQSGTIYFTDQSTASGEVRMGTKLSFYHDNELVDVPMSSFKSIELIDVKQGKFVVHQKGFKPISLLKLELKSGTTVQTEIETYDKYFCRGKYNFMVRRPNPLTGTIEEKSYNWKWHTSSTVDSNCLFIEQATREKEVVKVVFD